MGERSDDGPDRRREYPEAVGEEDRAGDDPGVVAERREAVEEEAAVGDEDLAEDDRRREYHRRQAHDPEEGHVQVALVTAEAGCDEIGRLGSEEEEHTCGHRHREDREGEDGPAELVRRVVLGALVPFYRHLFSGAGGRPIHAEAAEDRHEGGDESAGDEDVEKELGQDEGRVVSVELDPGAERPGEDPIADEAHQVAAEGQRREHDRAARHDRLDGPPGPGPGRPARSGARRYRGRHRRSAGSRHRPSSPVTDRSSPDTATRASRRRPAHPVGDALDGPPGVVL